MEGGAEKERHPDIEYYFEERINPLLNMPLAGGVLCVFRYFLSTSAIGRPALGTSAL
jgi:hypothetical protein